MERTNKRASWYSSYMRRFNNVERVEVNGCKTDRLTNGVTDSFNEDTSDGRDVHVNVQSGGSSQQNGYDARLDTQKHDIQFTPTSVNQQQTANAQQEDISWDNQDECVFENEPVRRSDVVREADRDIGAELPEVGMAKNLLSRFSQIGSEDKNYKREVTPPRHETGKVEFSSEPSPHIQVFEGKADAGIFESQPQYNQDVVRSGEIVNELLPERGTAKNIASKFKQLESGAGTSYSSHTRREITPDRAAGKVEFVSEPAVQIERYEGKADAGIFENQPQNYEGVIRSDQEMEEVLPEQGSAKSIANRFKQMEHGTSDSSPRSKREITPDRNTRGEYVSEPRSHIEIYEGKAEAGIFENKPVIASDVVRSEDTMEELLPQAGIARNIAAKFRDMESNVKSPPPTPGRVKEFTPPRDTGPVVVESQPQSSPDVISEHDQVDEIVPERGTARNIVSRFKQIEQENAKVITSNHKKEIIPPSRAETGVYENKPTEFIPDYNQKIDSGISENVPEVRSDVFKETDPAKYAEELPERGTAKNLVSRWKQMESQSGKRSPSSAGRNKEFTPPRNDERVRTPLSPGGHSSSVHPSDLPGQYQQSSEAPTSENEPQMRDDVFRETDTDWTEGMPKENAAKKMVAKFKHIQDEAKKEPTKPISRKEDSDRQTTESEITQQEATTPKKRGGFFIPTTPADKCGSCQKTVYAMEKFEMNKVIYHKNCFRCSHCKSKLTPKTFAVNNGVIFCTNHLMQLFKSKGNYDEGFGREQHKKKWLGESDRDSEQEQS